MLKKTLFLSWKKDVENKKAVNNLLRGIFFLNVQGLRTVTGGQQEDLHYPADQYNRNTHVFIFQMFMSVISDLLMTKKIFKSTP